jgi:hypothetical protein
MKNSTLRILVFLAVAVLVINIILFALKMVNYIVFWALIVAGAVFAYKVLPKMKKIS